MQFNKVNLGPLQKLNNLPVLSYLKFAQETNKRNSRN